MKSLTALVLVMILLLGAVTGEAASPAEIPKDSIYAEHVIGSVYRLVVTGAEGASQVQIPTWSSVNGVDDRVWYNAERNDDGTWSALINTARHGGGSMTSFAHADGQVIGSVIYGAPVPASPGLLAIHRIGAFYSVIVSNLPDAKSVMIPTWTIANGQDDIEWYAAADNGNGVWSVTVDTAKHGGGELVSHVYGDGRFIDSVSYQAPVVEPQVHTEFTCGTRYSILVENLWGAHEVRVPTWGTSNGQDDIIWYDAKRISPGTWRADVNAAIHDEGVIESNIYADGKGISGPVQVMRSYLTVYDENASGPASPDLSGYSRRKIEWGPGGPRDASGRSEGAITYQGRYGSMNADFIGPESSNIYLTFDEGYEAGYTPRILDTLKEKGVQAVFFVTAPYVRQHPDLVRRMIDEGHRVGSHSVSHPSFPGLSNDRALREVLDLHRMVQEQFGYEMTLFRFPEGAFCERDLQLLKALGYKSVFWSFAYVDWDQNKQRGYSYAMSKTLSELHPGAIYLLHAVSKDNASILPDFIDSCRNRGYTFSPYNL